VGSQLQKALSVKGLALLVNHGISEDKVSELFNNKQSKKKNSKAFIFV
jgi:isopenicillin N synthase-like dioxygenase